MRHLTAAAFALLIALGGGTVRGDSLPLPPNLVDIRSEQGEKLLLEADALDSYVPLSVNFVTQKLQSFCGVASIVIVLNALDVPAPTTPEYEPYHTFTQDNFLDERTEKILPREVLTKQGMTLDQLGDLLRLHPVEVSVHHAGESSVDAFRQAAREHLGRDGRAVVINYLRKAIGQERGGHISPLAAYDAETDRFLILDVARYKYPPVWVTAADLFGAMNTTDSDNENRTRGYVLVERKAEVAAIPAN